MESKITRRDFAGRWSLGLWRMLMGFIKDLLS
jgi:hypothetical protein